MTSRSDEGFTRRISELVKQLLVRQVLVKNPVYACAYVPAVISCPEVAYRLRVPSIYCSNMPPKLKDDKNRLKLLLLKQIKDNKLVLFGSFSTSVTAEAKQKKWEEIYGYALSIGFQFPPGKDWTYLRDTMWPNWRKRAIAKVDAKEKSGGEDSQFTDMEEAVLDVIGRESAAIVGIRGATEPWEDYDEVQLAATHAITDGNTPIAADATPVAALAANKEKQYSSTKPLSKDCDYSAVLTDLKIQKAKLQVERLEIANYKMRLEIMEVESRLGRQHKYPVDTPRAFELLRYDDDGLTRQSPT